MIHIVDDDIQKFAKNICDKDLFLFGAGKRSFYLCEEYSLQDKVVGIIDNNQNLHRKYIDCKGVRIPIISLDDFIEYAKEKGISRLLLLITPKFYIWEIVEQLDSIYSLDGLDCYIGNLIEDFYYRKEFIFSEGEIIIPKKIHYCWFGKTDIPVHLQKYIETWRNKCPDYEIIRWDESNYDVSKNQYMKQAYICKKWGFVPDYARLDIIYREGGIYLDTDVELLTSLDKLLCDDAFFGFNSNIVINLGIGFGAKKGHELILQLRDTYNDKFFLNQDGSMNLTPCSGYQHPKLKEYGFALNNEFQKINGVVVYPSEVLAPNGVSGLVKNFTKNTVANHHTELSWLSKEEKYDYERTKVNIVSRISLDRFTGR